MLETAGEARKVEILQCDTVSPYTGRVYPRSVVAQALNHYNNETMLGYVYDDRGLCTDGIPLQDATHLVENLTLEDDNKVYAEVKFLQTPRSQEVLDDIDNYRFMPQMTGMVDADNNVYDLTFYTVLLIRTDNDTTEK